MVAVTRPNDPGERSLADLSASAVLVAGGGDVRELQRTLWACAKRSPERRFHALYDRIHRSDVLWEAWRRVRSNGGAAGGDAETSQAIGERGPGEFLAEIQATLKAGQYRPTPVKRRYTGALASDTEGRWE